MEKHKIKPVSESVPSDYRACKCKGCVEGRLVVRNSIHLDSLKKHGKS